MLLEWYYTEAATKATTIEVTGRKKKKEEKKGNTSVENKLLLSCIRLILSYYSKNKTPDPVF